MQDADKLKALIESDPRTIRAIAREAGVSYLPLYRWTRRGPNSQKTYDVNDAGKVFKLLTGQDLVR